PTTGRDIGSYEVELSGSGNRPLRRQEVGLVSFAYPQAVPLNSITPGVPFSQQLTATFGTGNLTWSCIGTLPAGMTLSSLGNLSGTTSAGGAYPVTFRVTDTNGSFAESTAILTVAVPSAPVITSTNAARGLVGSTFTYQITASNYPSLFGASNLPSGLTINTTNGLISGIPAAAGTNSVTLLASNAAGTGSQSLTLTISTDYFSIVRARWSNSLVSNGLAVSSLSSISSKAYGYWKTNAAALNTNATSSSPGLWSDLPMTSGDATASGNMVTTFSRLEKMAQAYATPGCSVTVNSVPTTLTGNPELVTAIVNGLDWMVSNVFTASAAQYGNWFDWEVQGAQNFVDTQTLIYSQLTSTQIANYAAAVDNYGPDSANNRDYFSWGPLTGANTTSVALVTALRGALANDSAKIAQINAPNGVPKVFPKVTDGDGFYADGSYIF
ncbi:MAG: hypothetical protein EBT30_09735, partial [Verrucomicrobia bacterium]|nr:hypothetical protein [Verrucomicrobiota bacterium]